MPHAPVEPRSWWWRERPTTPSASGPLTGDHTADVVVVGGGIVGMSVAAALVGRGLDVVLVEAGLVGSGATGHTTAKLSALQSPRYAEIESRHGAEAATTYARSTTTAIDRVLEVSEPDGSGGRADALLWTDRESAAETVVAEGAAARRAGLPAVDVVTHDLLPLHAGLVLPDQGWFEPVTYLRLLLGQVTRGGGRVHESTPVTAVSLAGETRTVTTADGRVRAGHVVLATGLPILDRGLWFARNRPNRSHAMVATATNVPAEMTLRTGGPARSTRLLHDDSGQPLVLLAGSDHETGHDQGGHRAALREWERQWLGMTTVHAAWSAQDWRSLDGLPLVGPLVPGDDRILAAAGFDKWGLTSGTVAAAVLADRVLGRPATAAGRLFDPARLPTTAASLREHARSNAEVGWDISSGWVRAVTASTEESGELGLGEGRVVRDLPVPVAESRDEHGLHRCRAVCPHLGGIVRWDAEDGAWGCPLHGSRFAADGRVLSAPATRGLRPV